jgi:hypothetical protein
VVAGRDRDGQILATERRKSRFDSLCYDFGLTVLGA